MIEDHVKKMLFDRSFGHRVSEGGGMVFWTSPAEILAAAANLDGVTIRWCAEHGGQDAWEVEGNGEVAGYCIAVNYSDDQPLDPGECRMVSVLHIPLPDKETP